MQGGSIATENDNGAALESPNISHREEFVPLDLMMKPVNKGSKKYLGRYIIKPFANQKFLGLVSGLLPGTSSEPTLFRIIYHDGDSEDLEEAELRRFIVRKTMGTGHKGFRNSVLHCFNFWNRKRGMLLKQKFAARAVQTRESSRVTPESKRQGPFQQVQWRSRMVQGTSHHVGCSRSKAADVRADETSTAGAGASASRSSHSEGWPSSHLTCILSVASQEKTTRKRPRDADDERCYASGEPCTLTSLLVASSEVRSPTTGSATMSLAWSYEERSTTAVHHGSSKFAGFHAVCLLVSIISKLTAVVCRDQQAADIRSSSSSQSER
eukprot:753986-Hanusia_phi.AAC.10